MSKNDLVVRVWSVDSLLEYTAFRPPVTIFLNLSRLVAGPIQDFGITGRCCPASGCLSSQAVFMTVPRCFGALWMTRAGKSNALELLLCLSSAVFENPKSLEFGDLTLDFARMKRQKFYFRFSDAFWMALKKLPKARVLLRSKITARRSVRQRVCREVTVASREGPAARIPVALTKGITGSAIMWRIFFNESNGVGGFRCGMTNSPMSSST